MEKLHSKYSFVPESTGEYEQSVVKSARRVLQVFEFFAEYQKPARASEIAINLDFPQSSMSMLLRSLVSLGYLHFDVSTRLFEPSLRLSLLSTWRPEQASVAAEIVDLMYKIRDATGECVMLAEPYRQFVRYIHVLQSTDPEHVHYTPNGTLRPICSTAFGQMLLSLKSEKEVRNIIHRARSDANSLDYGINPESVLSAIARSRQHGYAHTSRTVGDFHSFQIATLLPATNDSPRLAIGITSFERGIEGRKELLLSSMMLLLGRPGRYETIIPAEEALPG